MIELIITSAGKKEIVNAQQTGTSAIKRCSALSGAFSFGSTGSKTTRFTTSELLRRMSSKPSTTRGLTPLITAPFSSIRSTMDPTTIPYLIAI